MKLPHTNTAFIAAFLACSAGLSAQSTHSGTTSALALGFSLDANGSVGGRDEVHIKGPLVTGGVTLAVPATQPGARAYPLLELAGQYANEIRFSAFSTGCSEIPGRSANGSPDLASSQNWMLAVVSVSDATTGSNGSLIEARRSLTGLRQTPGADLLGFYMTHSVGLSAELRGKTKFEIGAEALGLGGGGEVDAIDYGIGVITHALNDPQFVFFTNTSNFYFALDASCIAQVNAVAGSSGFAGGTSANTSTVYVLNWQSWNSTWSAPNIYRDSVELGIPMNAEIDALAVDPLRGNIVFSTKSSSQLPQLLFYDSNYNNSSIELVDGDGVAVTRKIGVKSNDVTSEVDGVDILDPAEGVIGKFYGTAFGLIATDDAEFEGEVGLSMTRSSQDDGVVPNLQFQATGWGSAAPGSGFVFFELLDPFQLGPDDLLAGQPWKGLALVDRNENDYEVELTIPVPASVVSLGMGVRATALDSALIPLGSSWATVFQLP